MVAALHAIPEEDFVRDPVPLMESFSPELYRWERAYFREHFVGALCGIALAPGEEEALERELAALALRLGRHRESLIHRDLQSQNVMIRGGDPVLIDFQGMRFGSRYYDLGSLLCDPYVPFSDAERQELLSFRRGLGRRKQEDFADAFWEASRPAPDQALGATVSWPVSGADTLSRACPGGLANLLMSAGRARSLPPGRALPPVRTRPGNGAAAGQGGTTDGEGA